MKTIVMLPACRPEDRSRLDAAAGNDAVILYTQEMEALLSADAIIGEPPVEILRRNPRLEWLQLTWAGTDKYTIGADFPAWVQLTNMSGAFGTVISEYVIGALLSVYRRFPQYLRQQQQGVWADAGSEDTICGKTALLLGTGDIGTATAAKLKVFGAQTIGVRRNPARQPACFDEMHGFEALDALLPRADIIICSLPNKPQTRGLIDRRRLLMMKPQAVLVNVGRGTLIDLDALVEVMQDGQLRGAILDVTKPEPLPAAHPLWHTPRVMLTPHIAGPSWQHSAVTQHAIIDICCENIAHYLKGEPLRNIVTDFEA